MDAADILAGRHYFTGICGEICQGREVASGGRLKIEVHPGGSIVGAMEILDAVDSGVLDALGSVSTYWMGKSPALALFTSAPMGFEPFMYLTWLYEEGGLELWQKAYDQTGAKVKVLPCGITHPELLAHSHKPIEKPADFKGLKYRTAAEFADMFRKMGVAITTLPGAEVYPSLERKIIDAAEFSTPSVNEKLAFHQVTQYYTGPGMHQPTCVFDLVINRDSWNALPDDLKAIVEIVARSTTLWGWAADFSRSMDALDKFKASGNKAVRVSDEAQRQFREFAWQQMDLHAEEDALYKEVWTSMKEYWKKFNEYENFMVPIRK